jgi:peptide-methionine (S)-S-oxide reductase
MSRIWLAGGCFWGVEAYFRQIKGVNRTTVGYGQGKTERPTYAQVCSGTTGHAEICEVEYDEAILPLRKLLEHFFRIIDPTTLNRQGPDRGTQYRSGIYFDNREEGEAICDFLKERQKDYAEPIVVEAESLRSFYPAEDYHQNYLQKVPGGYCHIDLSQLRENEQK